PKADLRLRLGLSDDRVERAASVAAVDLSDEDAVVPIVERHAGGGNEANAEAVYSDGEPLRELGDDPVPPMAGVSGPPIDEGAGHKSIVDRIGAPRPG